MIQTYFYNRTEYILWHKVLKSVIITEPTGWRNDGKEFARNKKYDGIFTKFSNSLKFIHNGYDFIKYVYDVYGTEAEIRLIKKERHPHTDRWEVSYSGFLDLSTYKNKDNEISVKFNSSGLEQVLKSRFSKKIEIERTTDLDGNDIPELNTEIVDLDGKRIFLKSKWETDYTENSVVIYSHTDGGNTRGETKSVPLKLIQKSHETAHTTLIESSTNDSSHSPRDGDGTTGICFVAVLDRPRTFRIKFDLSFIFNRDAKDGTRWERFWVRLVTYENGVDYNHKNAVDLFYQRNNLGQLNNQRMTFDFDQTYDLLEGESLSLQFGQAMDGISTHESTLTIRLTDIEASLSIDENSFFQRTPTKLVMAYELGQRITRIITSKDAFYSEFLGRTDIGYNTDGDGSLNGYCHGMWLRQFDKLPLPQEETNSQIEIINKYKPFTISFKDWFENEQVINNVGLGIEKIAGKEKIVVKPRKEFYNNNVTIRLGKVQNIERTVSNEFNFSEVEFGFEKGVENEEAMGLDDPHGKITFITYLKRISTLYRKVSKVIWSDYAREFIRRKPKSLNDIEDHANDKEIFGINLKRDVIGYREREWGDDFEKAPTGIFSPETATNLTTTPFNILLKHAWSFGAGFTKYLNEYIRYGSSTANSNLTTKLIGGTEYSENQEKIQNIELEKPRFTSEKIKFNFNVNFELMKEIEGVTIINGKEITNVYGIVEFVNDDNLLEKGFLINFKPNSNSWELLKANR